MKWQTQYANYFTADLGGDACLEAHLWEGYPMLWHFMMTPLIYRCSIRAKGADNAKAQAKAMILRRLTAIRKEVST